MERMTEAGPGGCGDTGIRGTENEKRELTDDERIDLAAERILKRFLPAFEELAK